MPPTIQTGLRDDRDKRQRPGERRSELICRVKYNNTLPDIPFDPKFITYPFESNRFIQYKPTSLERTFKYDLLTEHDLGVTIDLINPDTYKIDLNAVTELEDERLLEEESNAPQDAKRSRHHNTNVSWLRKTEYISTEYNRFHIKSDKSETKVGFKIKQTMKDEELYKDRDSQIAAIEHTFQKAAEPITKHYSKPNVTPVEVLPVFPDFELWAHPFAQVIFDSDPAPREGAEATQSEMSQAMIRGAVDESGEQFVAYFLPTDDTLKKRKRDQEEGIDYMPEEEYDFTLAREYNWNVKNKLSKGYEETYFFVFRDKGVYYNELETRVRLTKRRKTGGQVAKSRLIVKHRELAEREVVAQTTRMKMLEPPVEEEEEEPEQMELGAEGEVDELAKLYEDGQEGERENRSRSRSRSRSGSRSKSSSRSRSGSRSVSRSRSRSVSRSHSRSASRSRSRSASGSGSRSRSRSRSVSRSRSRSRSGSRSRSSSSSSGSERGSAKGSDAESEAESETGKKDAAEIFGSDSSDDSD